MDTFVSEPVIVNILELGAKFKVVKTIIFIGNVPSKVISALKTFLGGGQLNPILKKFYSKDWIERTRKLVRKDITIRGGGSSDPNVQSDDFNFDEPAGVEYKEEVVDDVKVDDELKKDGDGDDAPKEKLADFIKEETIDITDLERLTQAPVEEIEIETIIAIIVRI